MWQFMLGFSMGIYIGTYYQCKPTLDIVLKTVRDNMPKEKNKK